MKRPNILIITTDQQRWDALGANGNAQIKTPNLDRLAAEGVNFDRHFVNNPVCMPSRVSFLTGQYPATLRILQNGVPVPTDVVTLPRLLHPYGYFSANIGKLHFLPHANRDHRDAHPDYGFDQLEISDEPGCYPDAYRAWVQSKDPEQLDRISVGLPPLSLKYRELMGLKEQIAHPDRQAERVRPFSGRQEMTHSAFVADGAMEFLRRHRDGPFLCVAGFYSPHEPWVVPQDYLDLYRRAALNIPTFPPDIDAQRADNEPFSDAALREARHGYYAAVSEVDHHAGRILACLDALGIIEDTIVVFTSDHGEFLGEHLRYGKGYPAPDCISRVPLIVRFPSRLNSPGRTVHEIVEAVDVVPTLLTWAGVPVPGHLQGRPLPTQPGQPGKTAALTEFAGWKALRTDRLRYLAEASGRETLIHLPDDPGEYHNVAGDPAYAEALADCRARMVQKLIELERPTPRVWPY